jgi:hypothetical protein
MYQTTSNTECEHTRDSQTDGGAPHQAHGCARGLQSHSRGRLALRSGRWSHRGPLSSPLFTQMIRMHMVGAGLGRDRERRGVFGHSPILAR